eukprot:CAMPEP_0197034580 /NCGR_PEP_ID=MMETSP1384-20130603/12653_1 /TAXON_ID=29189 /ORGANISM="Ammonia sp." /LENGTH=677 /DNA_ID=CAMNT_0042464529 /DNA_START=26 /DNA_END=2059 /DNA_ORIENTATION=+
MSSLIKQIDHCLTNYYNHMGVPYLDDDGNGKFKRWTEENGYDSDLIKEELNTGKPDDSTMVDFDEDFPTDKKGDSERALDIFKKLAYCAKDATAFFADAELPGQHIALSFPDEQAQIQMATAMSLQDYTASTSTATTAANIHPVHDDEPRISGTDKIEPYKPGMSKLRQQQYSQFNNEYSHSQSHQTPYQAPMDKLDERGIYDHDEEDDYRPPHGHHHHATQAKPVKTQSIPREWIASDPIYESRVYALDLDAESIKDAALQQRYRDAHDLRRRGDRARVQANYKTALKCYSQIFVHLGCNGTRKLSEFVNDTGDANPLNAPSKVDIALDRLRMTAFLRMAEVYNAQSRWEKAAEKCNQVLDEKEETTNVKALMLRGRAYRKLRKFDSAKKDLERAKKCGMVSLDIEQEMSSLARNLRNKFSDDEEEEVEEMGIGGIGGIGGYDEGPEPTLISTFKNENYPQLPVRDEFFEQWVQNKLKHEEDTIPLEMGVLYPNPLKKPNYQFYTKQEVLDMAVIWLDLDVVRKVVSMSERTKFDLDRSTVCKEASYLNQLASGKLISGFQFEHNREKFTALLNFLCENDADLEERDDGECTALANTIKHNLRDLGSILLKFGANANDGTVKRESEQCKFDAKWVSRNLKIMRENTLTAIQEVVAMQYGVQNAKIEQTMLDYILSS